MTARKCFFVIFSILFSISSCSREPVAQEGLESEMFSRVPSNSELCAPTAFIPTAGLNLTLEEENLLEYICWPPKQLSQPHDLTGTRRGVPPGVTCRTVLWCDGDICSEVCEAGSVQVEAWLDKAARLQARLSRQLPFCFSNMLGTHNSGISLANGYGNLDPYFQQYFKYIKWALSDFSDAPLRTNDQWLSLTDQLNLGVRSVELDTHWVGGLLRIAHCGGIHLGPLNQLIQAINLVAKLLHRHIRWDTETLGCMPSLSSIPSLEQRPLVEALAEIRAWMDTPGNEEEFVLLFFDDQPDLMAWGVVERLQSDITTVFSPTEIFSTEDLAAYQTAHGADSWPSAAAMLAAGKRLVLVSRADYGEAMRPLIFSRGATVCGWAEPELSAVEGVPDCMVTNTARDPPSHSQLFSGKLYRVETCELEYGPLNCDFVYRGTNEPCLDEATMPAVLNCGLNMAAPDQLTPSKAAAAVWTWAPGHPYEPSSGGGAHITSEAQQEGSVSKGAGPAIRRQQQQQPLHAQASDAEANCAVISAADGRWRAVSCTQALPSACREAPQQLLIQELLTPPRPSGGAAGAKARVGRQHTAHPAATAGAEEHSGSSSSSGPGSRGHEGTAVLGTSAMPSSRWALSDMGEARGACPEGTTFDFPRHPVDNYVLASLLREKGVDAAWLPFTGPGWEVPLGGGVNAETAVDLS